MKVATRSSKTGSLASATERKLRRKKSKLPLRLKKSSLIKMSLLRKLKIYEQPISQVCTTENRVEESIDLWPDRCRTLQQELAYWTGLSNMLLSRRRSTWANGCFVLKNNCRQLQEKNRSGAKAVIRKQFELEDLKAAQDVAGHMEQARR